MTLPVSKYEELLETVRNLKQQTIRVRELASPLLDTIISANITGNTGIGTEQQSTHFYEYHQYFDQDASLIYYNNHQVRSLSAMDSLVLEQQRQQQQFELDELDTADAATATIDINNVSSSSEPRDKYSYQNHHDNMWHSEPSPLNLNVLKRHPRNEQLSPHESVSPTDMTSVMSFASSSGAAVPFGMNNLNNSDLAVSSSSDGEEARQRQQQLEVKVEMVYSLLAVLGTSECPDMGETLLALSSSPDSSRAMRQAGCLSILVQLVHAKDDENAKTKASQALRNLVQGQTDEKQKRRELKILKLLEEIRTHDVSDDEQSHPTQATENIIKLSFDEGYRHTICELGGIFTLARLIETEHSRHGSLPTSDKCITLRRYAGMALTNLTFGHGRNKSLLCSFNVFMKCLVTQLASTTDELRQVTASVLRNLSWRADGASRAALRDAGAVTALMTAAMKSRREATLKSVLSALWNLSAHCSTNKADICAVPGALAFLVDMLGYRPSATLTIIENAGGILRNVSSHIAIRDDYRSILREKGCLPLLLQQLKSPSLTVVSNACGTLWNLSAKCEQDQRILWDMGAAPMLRSLNHSKHAMIATGSRAALKNLLSSRPAHNLFNHMDSTAREMGLPTLPTLGARKQRALAKDLDQNLSETCDNIEPTSPPQLLSPISCELSLVSNNTTITSNETKQLVESFASLTLGKIDDRSDYPIQYEDDDDDDDEINEKPIDYSQKYITSTNVTTTVTTTTTTTTTTNYSDYAETDLDQPTNYSLRYAENDSDSSDIIQDPEGQFDTVKTYCTEGTPLNFSTATSMSDLRQIDDNKDKEKEKKKMIPKYKKKMAESPGLMTPEKPTKYCEEGTPRSFSRRSSFSSLNIDDVPTNNKEVKQEVDDKTNKDIISDNVVATPTTSNNVEVAAIIPPQPQSQPQTALETPLMFSRCSSLCSLSSAEQHSIHDDRSSIISDFSRLTSGIVSPSELPDSPTQTVPPSPRQRRAPIDFTTKPQPQQTQQTQQKSVFEDNVIKFKQANTPIEFSANTSLSSLTIDDELPANINYNLLTGIVLGNGINTNTNTNNMNKTTNNEVDEQEEDDMLAACINIGIQNNRHREKKQLKKQQQQQQPNKVTCNTGIPIGIKSSKQQPPLVPPPPEIDTTRVYCTEDTPAMLSHAGSQSDLSLLSVESSRKQVKQEHEEQEVNILDLSDDSSNLSGDNESNILAECIQSGMPKAKPTTSTTTTTRVNAIINADETATYAVEDSPCQFSLRSSLSDLTIDGIKTNTNTNNSVVRKVAEAEAAVVLSRAESLSSLSVESFESTENAALLEQCISSGMPPAKHQTSKNGQATSVATHHPIQPIHNNWIKGVTDEDTNININIKNNTEIKNNHDTIDKCSDLLDGSIEDNNKISVENNRMLDPDAMIESLDRFTAELVSQSSHLYENGNDTWNEDTSPNDVSFPSISISAPLVASFNSESDKVTNNAEVEVESIDTTSTMTESTLIAIEAANIIKNELLQESVESLDADIDLDHIKAPSMMNSLVSLTSSMTISDASPKMSRKRSLPIANLLMRRTLVNKNSHENLSQIQDTGPTSISSCSNLDYMKPPSVMGDFLDMVDIDMENSMISVASIASDADDDNTKQQYFMAADSTADLITDNVFEDCLTHQPTLDEVTLTEYSDANSLTPVQSDFASSSAESTPKKERSIVTRMTPKQRRQYAKDRYKTYTVAAEMVIQEQKQEDSSTHQKQNNKLTPKERRQLDRERFQTRVLDVQLIQQQLQEDLHLVIAQQANIVLDTLHDNALHTDELLDCETLSLVSNDDESELNSVSSVNYRTYHKSWGFTKNLPVVVQPQHQSEVEPELLEEPKIPKITKPSNNTEDNNEVKAIRGKRKPLYTSPYKRTMTSNLVKNVTTTIKSTRQKTTPTITNKPPLATQTQTKLNVVRSNTTPFNSHQMNVNKKTTPIERKPELLKNRSSSNGSIPLNSKPLERQGTFTKDNTNKKTSKIPESKIPTNKFQFRGSSSIQNRTITSTSNNRSPSTDRSSCSDFGFRRRSPQIHQSNSTQSLQEQKPNQIVTMKRSSNPDICSNTSGDVVPVTPKRKPVASRIASLWKKSHSDVGVSGGEKKKPTLSTSKIGIGTSTVKMRKKTTTTTTTTSSSSTTTSGKRLSRLGSFIKVDEIPVT